MSHKTRWTHRPFTNLLRRKIFGWSPQEIKQHATKTWQIAPSCRRATPSAFFLPNQLDRVTGWAFSDEHPRRQMEGGFTGEHASTTAYLLKDVLLIDGTLYKGDASSYLQARANKLPRFNTNFDISLGAIYCSPGGNEYFGQWLLDDCTTYALAASYGTPVSTTRSISPHIHSYQELLGISSIQYNNAYFKELLIFDDVGQNTSKRDRFQANKDKIYADSNVKPHSGVFIIRGNTGMPRKLTNELAVAEHLCDYRGFRILDPMSTDVETIRQTCAGAQTIIGVEGSHLIHGLMALKENCSLVSLMPPDRFYSLNKHITDRDHQHFGFVVGLSDGNGFNINIEEVERTLDLMPKATA
jgi:hypothetical protein